MNYKYHIWLKSNFLIVNNFQLTADAFVGEPGLDSGIYSLKQLHTLRLPASVITDEVIATMMLPNLRRLTLYGLLKVIRFINNNPSNLN
jgi:hypothetical protein